MAKIKILHIVTSLCVGGIERMAISVCNDLNKDDFDVTLLVLSDNQNVLSSQLNSDVKVIELISDKTNSGIKETVRLFCQKRKIEAAIKTIAPDIIHTHLFFYSVVPVLIAMHKAAPKARHVHTIHTSGLHYASDKRSIKIRYEDRWFKKNNTTVICVSREVQRRIKLLMPSIMTSFIPNYFDFPVKEPIIQRSIIKPSHKITIVYLSRLAEGKNHIRLLDAFAILVKNYPNAQLRLIGNGELNGELKKKAGDLKVEQNIEFCGYSNQVQELLRGCDIGVFPSEYEGFSVALVEMMSVGLPMCCSYIDSFKDLSIEQSDMLYFDPYSAEDMAAKIISIIDNGELRQKLYQSSIKISDNYIKGRVIPQYEQLYGAIK